MLHCISGTYNFSCQAIWIGVSTSIILVAPVMLEIERFNFEEMAKQDRNRVRHFHNLLL